MNFDVIFPENNIYFTAKMEQMVEREVHEKTICSNGVYNAEGEGAQGYNPVVVAVPTFEEENARLNEELAEKDAQLQAEQAMLDGVISRSITCVSNHRVTTLPSYAFYYWSELTSVDLPEVVRIRTRSLMYTGLASIDLPSLQRIEGKLSFAYSGALKTIILRSPTVVAFLYADAFLATPIDDGAGFIYVPDDLVEAYKTSTNWSLYANQIKPISELEA